MNRASSQPRLPSSLSLIALREWGFAGGVRVCDLQRACRNGGAAGFPVPRTPGVYLVVRSNRRAVRFLRNNRAGRFKRRDPTMPATKLRERWVRGAEIIYIGKAGGLRLRATLHSRLLSYMRFGLGLPAGHWGGRCIWQLSDAALLRIYWKPLRTPQPRAIEKQLLEAFRKQYGQRPFANLTG